MAPGAGSKFGAPLLEPELFQKQMHCIEESTCDIVGTFRRPGELCHPCDLGMSFGKAKVWKYIFKLCKNPAKNLGKIG